ncbi:ammonium transporter [Hyphococcus luteus]|uniref:Ammonium transporter n=1 Tax=Hyphococcus luteus TaxID=2058213 RepID=A0A2S7JZ84_9PROT|nr:ammonium transporter [Marinicaulis flavus]PQA85565.1 ammonium transporter [Marinicaulis flavus]
MKKKLSLAALGGAALATFAPAMAFAQEAAQAAPAPASDTSLFVFNTLLFLIMGMVVMFMAAGFCMLEAGLVRSKNAATICLKNIALYSVAGLMVYFIGYNLIYGIAEGGVIAPFDFFWAADDSDPMGVGYGSHSDWYFQMVFVATAASIVSGTLAERIKLWPFLIFTALLTGFIYPIQASWEWGAGWLDAMGFSDFAGSTLVHSTGGWAALAGALVLGPRVGKYVGGKVHPFPGSNLPLATLGTFILWLGWFGFNGGSQLALGTIDDAVAVGRIFVNTNTAACAGVVTAMIATQLVYKKVDLTIALNGAIGGLVSITAEPLAPTIGFAIFVGFVGGLIVTFAVPVLDKLKIDDVVGAIPAHLLCGIWGTFIVPASNAEATYGVQLLGIVAIGVFVFFVSLICWLALKYTTGIRVSEEHEREGLDKVELGLEAYPEFSKG